MRLTALPAQAILAKTDIAFPPTLYVMDGRTVPEAMMNVTAYAMDSSAQMEPAFLRNGDATAKGTALMMKLVVNAVPRTGSVTMDSVSPNTGYAMAGQIAEIALTN